MRLSDDQPSRSSERTVWILGAGFSRGLGAPLFSDLFNTRRRLEATLGPDSPARGTIMSVLSRYELDRGQLWRDPEEFLDFVETAQVDSVRTGAVRPSTEPIGMAKFTAACRWALAAECSFFLRNADPNAEKWRPYVKWAESLRGGRDSVISFNYDRVLEILRSCIRHGGDSVSGNDLEVILPDSMVRNIEDAATAEMVPVFKLHGSVDWIVKTSGRGSTISVNADPGQIPHVFEDGAKTNLLMGVPGPEKVNVARRLAPLWRAALRALSEASTIRFVGYRFPPTDAFARDELLKAIRVANRRTLRKIEVVLGPDSSELPRMQKLLGYVLGEKDKAKVEIVPLYGEDYLSLVWQ